MNVLHILLSKFSNLSNYPFLIPNVTYQLCSYHLLMISLGEASHFLTNGYEVTEQMARISMPTTTLERFAEAQSQMMSLVWSSELLTMRALGTSFLIFVDWFIVRTTFAWY